MKEIDFHSVSSLDLADIYLAIRKNREDLIQWLPFMRNITRREDLLYLIDPVISARSSIFVIRSGAKFVGMVGLFNKDFSDLKCEVGLWLLLEHRRQGVGIESLKYALDYAFKSLGMHRVYANVARYNKPSLALFSNKFFFKMDGVEREAERTGHHEYRDMYLLSLLENEYSNISFNS